MNEELSARFDIQERLHDYVRAMDRIDRELGKTVWHEDGTTDYGPTSYHGTGWGFVDWVSDFHEGLVSTAHHLGSMSLRIGGDRAISETYVGVVMHSVDDCINASGRYLDQWEKRGGLWKIVHRRTVIDMFETRPLGVALDPQGARDRSDPSYAVLDTALQVNDA